MRLSLYYVFFLLTHAVFSQGKTTIIDKEFSVLQERIKVLMGTNVDSSLILTNKIEKSGNNLHKAFAAGAKCYLFQLKGDSLRSKEYYRLAFDRLAKVPPSREKTKLKAVVLNLGGLSDWARGNLGLALDKYEEGKILSESINDVSQILKFNNNIAIINDIVANYRAAINIRRQTDRILSSSSHRLENDRVVSEKSDVYLHLGRLYELCYKEKNNRQWLDSSLFFYKKASLFSKEIFETKIQAQMGLGNIYYLQKDYSNAIKTYQSLLIETKEKNYTKCNSYLLYNLGDCYFVDKQYDNAMIYFKKSDSIYEETKANHQEYIKSNYFQAKIYEELNDHEKALKHSRIYLDNFEESETKLNKETTDVNITLEKARLKNEMTNIRDKYKMESLLKTFVFGFFIILLIVLLVFLIKNIREKKLIAEKVKNLIVEFSQNMEKKDKELSALYQNAVLEEAGGSTAAKKETIAISIDEEKEQEIVEKLQSLEKKMQFLNPDFTQQLVAKKIKTNTTYLSYVVNKRFGKSFSEYSNELKINYVINEMITNTTYRKYSTQAIAESVGYKNAVSFTKSFNKRTGVTPAQFIKELEKKQ